MGTLIGFVILGVIALALGIWAWGLFVTIPYETYRTWKYDRNGICPQCKLPYQYGVKSADQMYGPDRITVGVCPNGHKSIPAGNRHFAEW